MLTALGVGWTQRQARISYDTAIGVAFVAMFSLGILVLSRRTTYTPDLFSFIFGNILGVSRSDLIAAAVLAVAVLLFVAAFYRELLLVAYDPAAAAASGVPAALFQYAILVMIAIAVVVALKAIGIVLVNAMLIIPAATAGLNRPAHVEDHAVRTLIAVVSLRGGPLHFVLCARRGQPGDRAQRGRHLRRDGAESPRAAARGSCHRRRARADPRSVPDPGRYPPGRALTPG